MEVVGGLISVVQSDYEKSHDTHLLFNKMKSDKLEQPYPVSTVSGSDLQDLNNDFE